MPFNPLDVENVGVTLAIEFVLQPTLVLPLTSSFPDGGVYALYYLGPNPAYSGLTALNTPRLMYPVYVGKAARHSAKQGFNPRPSSSTPLFTRLNNHAASIAAAGAGQLDLAHFVCRHLRLDDAYISLAESVLITTFRPPWNGMGFGSKVVGGPRMAGKGSLWDALHPGRGGRPPGTPLQAAKAVAKIAKSQELLLSAPADPTIASMLGKIKRFV